MTVLEKSRACGGRARTAQSGRLSVQRRPPRTLFERRGATDSGRAADSRPRQSAAARLGLRGEKLYPLPRTAAGLWRSSLFSLAGKWAVTRFLAAFSSLSGARVASGQFGRLARRARCATEQARHFLAATFRLATYTADLERLSAGAALEQFKIGTAGVLYLDGGWQTLIDGLQSFVQSRGGQVQTVPAPLPSNATARQFRSAWLTAGESFAAT